MTQSLTDEDRTLEAGRQRDEARALVLTWHEADKGHARALLSGNKDEVKASVDAYNAAHEALLRWAGVEGETDSLAAVMAEPGALDAQGTIVSLAAEVDTAKAALASLKERLLHETVGWDTRLADRAAYLTAQREVIGSDSGEVVKDVADGIRWLRSELAADR